MSTDPFERVMRQLQDTIGRVGWQVTGVGGGPDSEPFFYTVGLTASYNHPELLLTGPWPPQLGMTLINTLGQRVKKGERLVAGRWYNGVIDQWAVPLLPVLPEAIAENFGMANRYYRERQPESPNPLEAFQMFLPDPNGKFPDDPGANAAFHARQPKWCVGEVRSRVIN